MKVALIIVLSIWIFIGWTAYSAWRGIESVREQAIERGYAVNCPATGNFSWKGECDD